MMTLRIKRIFSTTLLVLLAAGLCLARASAAFQSNDHQKESKPQPAATPKPTANYPLAALKREFKNTLPIPIGEKLAYEVRYSRFPIYASVGIVTFEFLGAGSGAQAEPINGLNIEFKSSSEDQFFRLRASAVSKGFLLALLGIDVKDRFETLVDAQDFSARLSFKEIKEGKKHTAESSFFDRAQQAITYTINDLNKPETKPREKTIALQEGSLDLLSAFYFVRLQKLKEGQMLRFPVSDDGINYTFDILVGKREKLKTDCGNVKTIRIEPRLFGPGQLISRQGEMTMWLSDDNKHVPLRLVAKTSSGTVTAKLLNFKKNCNIIDPESEEPKKTGNQKKGE
jgi:hypothetical protein